MEWHSKASGFLLRRVDATVATGNLYSGSCLLQDLEYIMLCAKP